MDIKAIKEIIDLPVPDQSKRYEIIKIISQDEEVFDILMRLLASERDRKRELIIEMNFQLSRAHVAIETPIINKDEFVQEEIRKFYIDNYALIGHCFANMNEEVKGVDTSNRINRNKKQREW